MKNGVHKRLVKEDLRDNVSQPKTNFFSSKCIPKLSGNGVPHNKLRTLSVYVTDQKMTPQHPGLGYLRGGGWIGSWIDGFGPKKHADHGFWENFKYKFKNLKTVSHSVFTRSTKYIQVCPIKEVLPQTVCQLL